MWTLHRRLHGLQVTRLVLIGVGIGCVRMMYVQFIMPKQCCSIYKCPSVSPCGFRAIVRLDDTL